MNFIFQQAAAFAGTEDWKKLCRVSRSNPISRQVLASRETPREFFEIRSQGECVSDEKNRTVILPILALADKLFMSSFTIGHRVIVNFEFNYLLN